MKVKQLRTSWHNSDYTNANIETMDLSSGYPLWLIKSGLPYNYPFLEKDIRTDVLILGGGISGALMAYYLVEAGINCTLIDGRTIGLGSSCASTSLLQYEIDVPLIELSDKIGKQNAVAAYNLSSDAIDKLESIAKKIRFTEFERKQSLYFAAFKKDIEFLKKEFLARKQAGFDISYLNQTQIKKQFGFASPAALLSQQAAQTNAYNFTHALLQYCIRKGLKVYDRTEAVSIKHSGKDVTLLSNRGFKLKAKKLVYATGYEAVQYIDSGYVKLQSTYAVCSEQMNKKSLEPFLDSLLWNTADPYFYMRITGDNRILIGGRDEEFYNPRKRDDLLHSKTKNLVADFKKLFPLISFRQEFSWTGTFGSTRDGLPFIGNYKKLPNSYFALGFGGNGITFSQIAAEMITGMIQGKTNNKEQLFSFDRI